MSDAVSIRHATVADAAALATLMNLAADGIPAEIWATLADPGEDPMAVGRRRAARSEGAFSYRQAWIADRDGDVLGMAFGYPLDGEPATAAELAGLPANVRPFVALEEEAQGSFYLNGIATVAAARRKGVGRRLMDEALLRARAAGTPAVTLSMFRHNAPAAAFYRSFGFVEIATRPPLADPVHRHRGEIVLLRVPVGVD